MSLTELLCCLVLVSLCISGVVLVSSEIISSLKISLSRTAFDSFIERQRLEAVVRSRPVEVFYDFWSKRVSSTTGAVFEDCLWENSENFRIRFNGDGSITILSGSTTLNFADGSVLTIQPVTGKVTY
jgi:Tfp pilus assembly protein FimT